MTFRFPTAFASLSPVTLIVVIVAIKAAAFFLVIPRFESTLAPFYSVGFVDDYDKLAINLSEGNGYRFSPDTAPTLTREPGYPLLLAGLFSIFGYSLTVARIVNVLLSAGTALLISRLAIQSSATRSGAFIAPALFLVHPGIVVAELRGGVEIVFIFLLMIFLTTVWKAICTKRLAHYFLAGIALGFTSLFRSTALLFPLFLIAYFVVIEKNRPTLGQIATRLLVMVAGSVLILSPWIARNFLLSGQFVPTASVQGIAAHAGNYICTNWSSEKGFQTLDLEASYARRDLARAQGLKFEEEYYLYFFDVKDELSFNSYLGNRVMTQYRESPTILVKCMFRNAFNFWFSGKNQRSTMANLAIQVPYLILAAIGLLIGFRSAGRGLVALLALFVIYNLAVYLPIHSQARYSIPLLPIISILAAIFLERVFDSLTARRHWRIAST